MILSHSIAQTSQEREALAHLKNWVMNRVRRNWIVKQDNQREAKENQLFNRGITQKFHLTPSVTNTSCVWIIVTATPHPCPVLLLHSPRAARDILIAKPANFLPMVRASTAFPSQFK